MKVIENNFDNAEVNHLLTKHFIELRSVSPDDSCHVLDIKGLKDSSIKFWSFWAIHMHWYRPKESYYQNYNQ